MIIQVKEKNPLCFSVTVLYFLRKIGIVELPLTCVTRICNFLYVQHPHTVVRHFLCC